MPDHLLGPLNVALVPAASLLSGCELLGVALVVDSADGCIDPAEADGLFHRVVVRYAVLAGVLLVVD